MANGIGSLGFSIGMDPRPFLAQRGLQIQNRRIVPIPGFSQPAPQLVAPMLQPAAPMPQPAAPMPQPAAPMPQPAAPMPQPTPPPMIPELPPALPSEQLNMQPPVPPMQEPPPMAPPPMAPPVVEQPPIVPPMAPPITQPVMDQSDNDSVRGFFGRLRDSGFTFPERPIASPGDNMMRPTPLLPPSDNMTQPEFRFNNPRLDRPMLTPRPMPTPPPRFGLDGILGGFDRFRPPPPPRFGLPDGLDGIGFDRFLERFSPPRFGLNRIAPMPRFSPFNRPRRQG